MLSSRLAAEGQRLLGSKHVEAVGSSSGDDIGLWVPGQVEQFGAQVLVQHFLW